MWRILKDNAEFMKQHRALCILIVSLGAGVAWYVTAKVKDGRISQLTTRESGLKDEIRDLKADHGREMQRVRQDRDRFELISRTVFPNAVPASESTCS